MNTIESCAAQCPIVQGLPDEIRLDLLGQHRTQCLERRMGQLGILCGIPGGEAKNQITRAALEASKQVAFLAV